MKTRLAAAAAILLSIGAPGAAHRLDEYLQATLISLEKDRVQTRIRLAPGVAVLPIVLAMIDTDADGAVSEPELRAYAERVILDLSVAVDGDRLRLSLVSTKFAGTEAMREGRGEIELELAADLPRGGPDRKLVFENRHQSPIGVYLANSLVPHDPDIRLIAQNRNDSQSLYELRFVDAGVRAGPLSLEWWSGGRGWLATAALLLFARLALLWRQRTRQQPLGSRYFFVFIAAMACSIFSR